MKNNENICVSVYGLSKISARTIMLLHKNSIDNFNLYDGEKIVYSDIGSEYSKENIGHSRLEILTNLLSKKTNSKSKLITSTINNTKSNIDIIFDYLLIDINKIIQLMIKKKKFIYCLITKNNSYIFSSNSYFCIECFCYSEKIIPKLQSANISEEKEISKIQYKINDSQINYISEKISKIFFSITKFHKINKKDSTKSTANSVIKEENNGALKINNKYLHCKNIKISNNKNCGILQKTLQKTLQTKSVRKEYIHV